MPATPIGLMNHITMSTPDVPAAKRFWIDFLGGEWYSESYRLIQVLVGGILVDFFPPVDPNDAEAQPMPGSLAQRFRFTIAPEQVGPWVARADAWRVPTTFHTLDELQRLSLIFEAPGGYHVALEAHYPTPESLRQAEQQYAERTARLATTATPLTADREPIAVPGRAPVDGRDGGQSDRDRTSLPSGRERELALLERAVAIAETGIYQLGYHVRAGMPQSEALAILEAALLRAGADPGHQTRWECSAAPRGAGGPASDARLQRFDVILAELTPRVRGYGVRELHPVCVGKPHQVIYELFELNVKLLEQVLPLLTPGQTLVTLRASPAQASLGTPFDAELSLVRAGRAEEPLEAGMAVRDQEALTVHCIARARDGTAVGFATTALVTPDGGRRLSRRPLELMLTSRSFLSAYTDWRPPEPLAPWQRP